MTRPVPTRIQVWLIISILINIAGVGLGFAEDWTGKEDWLLPLRGILLALSGGCLAVFAVKLWRWWPTRKLDAQDSRE
ncbi:MAG TPA: hypothetical protein VE547_10235 [Mycobacteriales bacterium]|nr:hypothetical protein [Mycobacteriales bacterium]